MKAKIIQLIAIGIIVLASSCKKDPPIIDDNPNCPTPPCVDNCPAMYEQRSVPLIGDFYKGKISPMCVAIPYYILKGKFTYLDPIRNPNNPYEIAFLRFENGVQAGDESDLCVYNFCSNSLKIIANQVAYTPDWSVKNWIIYTGTNRQLYKVKSNGDSLTQLTNTGNYNNHAVWNPDGTKYLYHDVGAMKMKICNEDGSFLKYVNLNQGMEKWAWLNDEEIIYSKHHSIQNSWAFTGIYKYNINSGQGNELVVIKSNGVSLYIKSNKVFIAGAEGMYLMENGNLTLIDSCYQSYGTGYVQPLNNDLLLLNRAISDTSGYDSCIVYQRRFLSLIDINTKKEREIKIPE